MTFRGGGGAEMKKIRGGKGAGINFCGMVCLARQRTKQFCQHAAASVTLS
jgi:hypothetical protein